MEQNQIAMNLAIAVIEHRNMPDCHEEAAREAARIYEIILDQLPSPKPKTRGMTL